MGRLLLAALMSSVALVASEPANAKGGPTQALIEGPGLEAPIVVEGTCSGMPAARALAEETGFLVGALGAPADALSVLPDRPAGSLGPAYTITYLVRELGDRGNAVRQTLYPHAEPAPITYTPPRQTLWPAFGPPGRETTGSWFRTTPLFVDRLAELGLPGDRQPDEPLRNGSMAWAALLAVVVPVSLVVFVLVRRRAQSAGQTSTVTASRSAS